MGANSDWDVERSKYKGPERIAYQLSCQNRERWKILAENGAENYKEHERDSGKDSCHNRER